MDTGEDKIKGALRSFKVEILIRREISLLTYTRVHVASLSHYVILMFSTRRTRRGIIISSISSVHRRIYLSSRT